MNSPLATALSFLPLLIGSNGFWTGGLDAAPDQSIANVVVQPARLSADIYAAKPKIKLVEFPDVGLAIPQPIGFEKATSFYGFQQSEGFASILLSKLPVSYQEIAGGFDKKRLATRGMSLLSKQTVKIDRQDGLLLQVEQSAGGNRFLKWVVIFGDEQNTHIVTANFLKKNSAKLSLTLKNNLLAVVRIATASTSSLPFTIQAVDGLVTVQKVAGLGKVAAFTKDGRIPLASPEDPWLVVAPSLGNVPVVDQKSFAINRLDGYAETKISAIQSTKEIVIDNLSGWEIEATGQDSSTKTPLKIYQVMLFPPQGGYILISGFVGEKQAPTFLPKFQAMAKTYKNSPIKP